MNIYIAVLFICLVDTCNFMQGSLVHKTELQCRMSLEQQKRQLTEIAVAANQGEITILEGMCVTITLKPLGIPV